jgi:hypothetical protein
VVVVEVVVLVTVVGGCVTVLAGAVAVAVDVRTVTVGVPEAVFVFVTVCWGEPPGDFVVTVFVPTPAATLMMKATAAPATNAARPISQALERFSCSLWPHSGQNELPGGTGAPQLGHTRRPGAGRSHSSWAIAASIQGFVDMGHPSHSGLRLGSHRRPPANP